MKSRNLTGTLVAVGLLHGISSAAIAALSMRTCATMLPPSSATAMFMGWPSSFAFFSAAAMIRRASSSLTAECFLLGVGEADRDGNSSSDPVECRWSA